MIALTLVADKTKYRVLAKRIPQPAHSDFDVPGCNACDKRNNRAGPGCHTRYSLCHDEQQPSPPFSCPGSRCRDAAVSTHPKVTTLEQKQSEPSPPVERIPSYFGHTAINPWPSALRRRRVWPERHPSRSNPNRNSTPALFIRQQPTICSAAARSQSKSKAWDLLLRIPIGMW